MANEVFEAARTVMAVREYQERPLPDEVVRRIVEAGRLTASAANRQPWHFVLVRERSAAAAVIVACERNASAHSDASRAIQSMILVAWGEGVGSNWTGFGGLEDVRVEFGLPETYDVLAVIPLGYPNRKVVGRKKRKPFDQVVSAERFGRPLPY